MLSRRHNDDGSLTVLIIGYAAIAAVLIVAGIDVSAVFLARRALSSAADSAALAGAQAVDRSAVYDNGAGSCGDVLPLDPDRAASAADNVLTDDQPDLQRTFAELDPASTSVDGGTVTVRLSGAVSVPFGHVLGALLPGMSDGEVHVAVSSSAQSPVVGPSGC